MPTIGKYVVQMLDGTLDEEKKRRWAWDRENDGAACIMYIPTRDLKDIAGYVELTDSGGGWSRLGEKMVDDCVLNMGDKKLLDDFYLGVSFA